MGPSLSKESTLNSHVISAAVTGWHHHALRTATILKRFLRAMQPATQQVDWQEDRRPDTIHTVRARQALQRRSHSPSGYFSPSASRRVVEEPRRHQKRDVPVWRHRRFSEGSRRWVPFWLSGTRWQVGPAEGRSLTYHVVTRPFVVTSSIVMHAFLELVLHEVAQGHDFLELRL